MKNFINALDILIVSLNKTIAVLGLASGTLLAFANVVARYFFDKSWSWASELSNYLFIWSAFFGAACGFNNGIHVSETVLVE